ncbi:MAG: OmpA family protein [Deltaproteobacteria bacterium]|nr:OmpA family protein [Deltaproteobacteria bacterium]
MNANGRIPRPLPVVLLLALLTAACAKNLGPELDAARTRVDLARERGAKWCSPREFASAEAYLDFARDEAARGRIGIAEEHLARARENSTAAIENSADCRSDLDGDRIADPNDGDPYRAEDYDGWDDSDGVPDYDNDGDGLLDKEDGCPDSPEDFDSHNDRDGCPDLDNDQDGVPDALDQCPALKEDLDGWQDNDGCPDPDNDGDGFPDALDKCPNGAETPNGFLDDDGCPDIQPRIFKILVPPEVHFAPRSNKLSPNDRRAIQEFAVQLVANPELGVRVEAHVETSGNAERDRQLTQTQADAVARALIDAGIDAGRVIAIGFGGDRPIEGAPPSENRRIIFAIYQTQ